MDRKRFISLSSLTATGYLLPYKLFAKTAPEKNSGKDYIMTVQGKVSIKKMGITLPHEHVVTDFTGAQKVVQPQYKMAAAFNKMLPYLKVAKQNGV